MLPSAPARVHSPALPVRDPDFVAPDSHALSPSRWVRPPGFVFAPVYIALHNRAWYMITLECFALPGHMGQPPERGLQEMLYSWTVCPRILAFLPMTTWVSLAQANDECHQHILELLA